MALSDQYAAQQRALSQRGALWQRLRGPVVTGLRLAFADTAASFHEALERLRIERDPRTTSELLPEWEASCGLPDGCIPGGGSIEQRRAAVVGRLRATGGVSPAYFVRVAAAAGYTITVESVAPAVWRVHAPAVTITEMTCNDTCNDALRVWGNEQLECLLGRVAPAHTVVQFAYGA